MTLRRLSGCRSSSPESPTGRSNKEAEQQEHHWQPLGSPVDIAREADQVRFLHVVEQGALLRKTGSRIVVTKQDSILLTVPTIKLDGVFLFGNIHATGRCLRMLMDQGIWLAFFTSNGRYRGRLQSPEDHSAELRRLQWERLQDEEFCVEWARSLVRAKILGQRQIAAGYARNYLAETLGEGHSRLRESLDRTRGATDLQTLRGVEGASSLAYFKLFRRWNRSSMPFDRRSMPHAGDPVNSLLNLGYTLLGQELEGILQAAGLDTTSGFYHVPYRSRPSLAYDWLEEFRHVVVDRLVLKLINQKSITEGDFQDHERKGLRLQPEALRKFLIAYEKVMRGEGSAKGGYKDGYRKIFLQQLPRLIAVIEDSTPYESHLER